MLIHVKPKTKALLIISLLFLSYCTSNPSTIIEEPQIESTAGSINELIQLANTAPAAESVNLRLEAINLLLDENEVARAVQQFEQIQESALLSSETNIQIGLMGARLALAIDDPEKALEELLSHQAPLSDPAFRQYAFVLSEVYLKLARPIDAYTVLIQEAMQGNTLSKPAQNSLWQSLTLLNAAELDAIAVAASNYEIRGWVELARTTLIQQANIKAQLDAIDQWQRIWSSHSAANDLPTALRRLREVWETRPRQIALILPIQEPAGIAIQEGFLGAYFESMTSTSDTPKIRFYDSSLITNIYPVYDEAVAAGAELIIGPLDKDLVNQLQRLPSLPVPTLALNYADTASDTATSNFYQFGLAPEDEISQAAELAAAAGFVNAAIITPTGQDYTRLSSLFEQAWQSKGGTVVSQTRFDNESNYADVIKQLMSIDSSEARGEKIEALLPRNNIEFVPRRRQDIDFIYLIANPRQGRQIKPTLGFYFAENLPVLAYPSIYDGSNGSEENRDLDGIVLLDAPWLLAPNDEFKTSVNDQLRAASGPLQRLRALGIDSFRLYARLNQMTNFEIQRLIGVTGILTMTPQQKLQRELDLAVFNEGTAIVISGLNISEE